MQPSDFKLALRQPLGWAALTRARFCAAFVDIARLTGGKLEEIAEDGGAPYEVLGALVDEAAKGSPTIVLLEDLHWADEATLDVLRLLGRRIESFPGVVLATYRDDELEDAARLRIVVGELARIPGVQRLELARLSPDAVAELADPRGVNAAELYRRTGGNPLFISEVLAAGSDQIPETVRDAVLARVVGLSRMARMLLEALASFQLRPSSGSLVWWRAMLSTRSTNAWALGS